MPAPTDADLRALIRSRYGDEPTHLERLPGDVDANVRVTVAGGRESVLKVVAAGRSSDRIDLQVAALDHLAERLPAGTVPGVIRDAEGRAWSSWTRNAEKRIVWRLEWLPGPLLAASAPHRSGLFASLGAFLGRLDGALADFGHAAAARSDRWDPSQGAWIADQIPELFAPNGDAPSGRPLGEEGGEAGHRAALLRGVLAEFEERVVPRLDALPRGVIHADANDYNLLVDRVDHPERVVGIFDFGDLLESCRVCEPAVAAAYAALRSDDPLGAMADVFGGYHAELALGAEELAVAYPLARMRLAVSVVVSARRKHERPDDPYVTISEAPAWRVLEALRDVHPRWAEARIRDGCGLEPFPTRPAVSAWLDAHRESLHPVAGPGLAARSTLLDLSVGSPLLGADPRALETGPLGRILDAVLAGEGAEVGVGRWDEPRPIYLGELFAEGDHPCDEHRTVHLGVDLFMPAGRPLHLPLEGTVASLGDNTAEKDYGPVVLVRHEPDDAPVFWTLWGHLDPEVLDRLAPGDAVAAGALLARVGAPPRNGDWPPHPHIQLVLDPLDRGHDVPGVAPARERDVWCALSPNPAALVGLSDDDVRASREEPETLLPERARLTGPNLSLSYRTPIHAVRGWMQYLYDHRGRGWLDLYNNVPHVGHSHPAVAEAVARQFRLLATNTRYLSRVRLEYLDRLTALFPDELDTVYLVNSASEANELALRIARAATGRRDIVVQEAGYHGHTTTLIDVSPYKAGGPGGEGTPDWVHVVPVPDDYRGAYRRDGTDPPGPRYAADVAERVERMQAAGRDPGAFLAETFPSVGGQIVPPAGYLSGVYEAVRAAGGVCIADEVQTGFGRLGEVFWGFEQQGVVPDLVVLGKPMANGFPLGAVVARRELVEAFDTGMEFFSTFGGNPVACAAGRALLDVLEDEGSVERARRSGANLLEGLRERIGDHPRVGDVRGLGLFVGVELVEDRGSRRPDPSAAAYLRERLMEEGILTGTDGPHGNVLKLRGPLVVTDADVRRFLDLVPGIFAEPFLAAAP